MAPLALSRITLIATTFLTFQHSSPAQSAQPSQPRPAQTSPASPASPDLRLFLHPLLLEPAPAQAQHRQHGHSSRAEARNYRVGCVQSQEECGVARWLRPDQPTIIQPRTTSQETPRTELTLPPARAAAATATCLLSR